MSCLAEQAKILMEEAEENNLDWKVKNERWRRWDTCSLCEQDYHGVVKCALGWACWKTYLSRPEEHWTRLGAMRQLGNGLLDGRHYKGALSVQEAELAMRRRLGASESQMLVVQNNLAISYESLGRDEEAMRMKRDVYSGRLKLNGEEDIKTHRTAYNYANSLLTLKRFEEAKALLRKTMPVARRVLRESHIVSLGMRWIYAKALYLDAGATLNNIHEAVATLEDTERTARRVMGGAHPLVARIENALRESRAALDARETASA